MLLEKFQYLPGDTRVGTDVPIIHFPVAHFVHLRILGWHDADRDLCCLAQVRTIERNRRNRPTPQPFFGLLTQALEEPVFHHFLLWRSVIPICWDDPETPALLRLDVGRPDHLAPLLGFRDDKVLKFGGRHRHWQTTSVCMTALHLWLRHSAAYF